MKYYFSVMGADRVLHVTSLVSWAASVIKVVAWLFCMVVRVLNMVCLLYVNFLSSLICRKVLS